MGLNVYVISTFHVVEKLKVLNHSRNSSHLWNATVRKRVHNSSSLVLQPYDSFQSPP